MEEEISWLSYAVSAASSILLGALVSYFSINFIESKKVKLARKRARDDFFDELKYLKEHIDAQLANCIRGILSFKTIGDPIELIQMPHFLAFDDTILKRSYTDAAKHLNYQTRVAVNGLISRLADLESKNGTGIEYQVSLLSLSDSKTLEKHRKAALTNLRNVARSLAADYYLVSEIIEEQTKFERKNTEYDRIRNYLDEKGYNNDAKEYVISFSMAFKVY